MCALIQRLSNDYRSYHESNKALLEWIGLVGAIAFPLLYALRFTGKMPPLYNDLALRAVATMCCVLLALRRWWPERLQRYYLLFSYGAVLYCLAFMLPLTLLHNRATTPVAVNMVVSVVLVVLLTDWRNTLVMLVCGYTLSAITYGITATDPRWPVDFLLWWFPVCGVLVAGGGIGKHVEKKAEMERLRRLQTDLTGRAGSIAHEVRTPLAQIESTIDRAMSSLPPNSEAAHLLAQGRQAVRRGLQAVTITLQQISGKPLNPAEFKVLSAAHCLRKIVDAYAYDTALARERVHLQVEEDFCFRGDETAFELTVFNLLKNALYYLPLHPQMDVQIRVLRHPQPCVVVRDSGPGMDPSLLPRLFGEFETRGKTEGTGLGLAFCRRVLEAFGGSIQCRSQRGVFTEFILSLPACTASESARARLPDPEPGGLRGRTLLVVDDQTFNRVVAKTMLTRLGAYVLQAEHGEQALGLLRGGCVPDAILMDVSMPGLDGMATTRLLRAMPGPAGRVPVLALTANDSTAQESAAHAAGMQGVLGKPIDAQALEHALLRICRQRLAEPSGHVSGA
jgi:signal transduction histidine kinase/CheY-like chemotaxis protein